MKKTTRKTTRKATRKTPASALDRARKAGSNIGSGLLGAGRQVWLAGLGTAAAVEERARGAFSTLVEQGEMMEERVASREKLGRAKARLRDARKKIEKQTEKGVTTALHFVGLPTYHEINTLIDRVEKLTHRVESLGGR